MTKKSLVAIRAAEEISEHGSIGAAIEAVERQLSAPECQPAERSFMRKVRNFLLNAGNKAFYEQ